MGKIETAAQREEKVKELSRRITFLCTAFYERATDDQKETLWALLEGLEKTLIAYRNHEEVWDSKLIDVVIKYDGKRRKSDNDPWIEGVHVKTKAFSTFDSVMDKARSVFEFITTN